MADSIAPIERDDVPSRQRPVYRLAGAVQIDGDIATANGIYDAFVNRGRGDIELTPGWPAYRSRLEVQTYDVTDYSGR